MDSNSRGRPRKTNPAFSAQRAGLSGDAIFARERGAREKFVVVQWDQRGTGRTYGETGDAMRQP